jgi:phage terminase large subunit-like protein
VISCFKKYGWYYDKINYDSYSAGYLVDELASMGFSRDRCQIATPQGYKTLSVPMQEMQALLKEKKLVYQNNPVTKWMFSNIELEQDRNGNQMPKKAGEKLANKIDGPATILNCLVSYCAAKSNYMRI